MIDRRQVLASAALLTTVATGAQAFPTRPITLIVPFAPGGIADLTARAVAEAMGRSLGQAMVVDNRPGAGSIVASQAVLSAAPDGHTLLLVSNGHAVSAGLFKHLPFDVQRDFAPISMLASFDLAAFVAAESRFKTLAAVLGHARANPGKLTIGTVTVGSTQHLAAELFKSSTGIDALVVPYKASPAVMQALRTGEIDIAFEILGPWLGQVQGGTLRALAVSSGQRFAALPEVPTMQQAGVANYDVASWNALAAPARTPAVVVARLNRAANEALQQVAVANQLHALGVRAQGGTPEQMQALLAADIRRWAAVIRKAEIEPQ